MFLPGFTFVWVLRRRTSLLFNHDRVIKRTKAKLVHDAIKLSRFNDDDYDNDGDDDDYDDDDDDDDDDYYDDDDDDDDDDDYDDDDDDDDEMMMMINLRDDGYDDDVYDNNDGILFQIRMVRRTQCRSIYL